MTELSREVPLNNKLNKNSSYGKHKPSFFPILTNLNLGRQSRKSKSIRLDDIKGFDNISDLPKGNGKLL